MLCHPKFMHSHFTAVCYSSLTLITKTLCDQLLCSFSQSPFTSPVSITVPFPSMSTVLLSISPASFLSDFCAKIPETYPKRFLEDKFIRYINTHINVILYFEKLSFPQKMKNMRTNFNCVTFKGKSISRAKQILQSSLLKNYTMSHFILRSLVLLRIVRNVSNALSFVVVTAKWCHKKVHCVCVKEFDRSGWSVRNETVYLSVY